MKRHLGLMPGVFEFKEVENMRLNHDCIRDLLLELEDKINLDNPLLLGELRNLETYSLYGEDTTFYTVFKLKEAGFINASWQYASDSLYWLSVSSITWEGHQFLDNIRENEVWKETKNKIKGFSSVSITILAGVAQEYLKKKLLG